MRTCLGSAALPAAPLDELRDACRRRGFAGLALRATDAHGVHGRLPAHMLADIGALQEPDVVGIVSLSFSGSDLPSAAESGHLTRLLGAATIIPFAGGATLHRLEAFADAGARVWLDIDGADDVVALTRLQLPEGVGLSWRADPRGTGFAEACRVVPAVAGSRLRQVTLSGAGPESVSNEGRGVGALMSSLALAAWDGALVLEPGSRAALTAWRVWLGRSRGWGCGSAAEPLPLAT